MLSIPGPSALNSYLLLEDGKTILFGKFGTDRSVEKPSKFAAPIENPVQYLLGLKRSALSFIAAACPRKDHITQCDKRMLETDLLEWMVSWTSDENSQIIAVELLHERKFLDLGNTLNVIFAE